MADAGTRAADSAQARMERKLRSIYRDAQREIIEKLDAHTKRLYAMDAQKRAELEAGKITKGQYEAWLRGQVFASKQWKDKVDSVATTLLYANQQANAIVEGEKRAVFGENATYQAYKLEHDMGADLSFSLYDSATVTRLLKDDPELLPRKVVNGKKDKAWNRGNMSTAITQGIIQGESIPAIAERIAKQTASTNMKAMTRYARTAMTSAQNAGRMEVLHEAQDMDINVRKKWLATLDKRTRDAHAHLDGQVQDIDKPFKSDLGDIMFPGDPHAAPGNVYNCRCTLIYVYPEYHKKQWEDLGGRYDQENDEVISSMSFSQWKAYKEKKAIGTVVREQTDVTDEYLANAEPGKGTVTWDTHYKFLKKQEREVWGAYWLRDNLGGDVQLLQEIDTSEGIRYSDYIWRARYWELKSPERVNAINGALNTAIKQIEVNPGGIVLDLHMPELDIDRITHIADMRIAGCGFNVDLIILNNDQLVCVKRYKK